MVPILVSSGDFILLQTKSTEAWVGARAGGVHQRGCPDAGNSEATKWHRCCKILASNCVEASGGVEKRLADGETEDLNEVVWLHVSAGKQPYVRSWKL